MVEKNALVKVNGQSLDLKSTPGTFLAISRKWADGDHLEVSLPLNLRFEPIDSLNQDRAALMYGPVMLVSVAEKELTLTGDIAEPDAWIKRVPGTVFDFATQDGQVFRPFYLITDEHYTTYPKIVATGRSVQSLPSIDKSEGDFETLKRLWHSIF